MNEINKYEIWIEKAVEDIDLINELNEIKGNEEAVFDRFYKELEFGTGGLRGVIGAGTNRMNVYTVKKATQGIANYLNESGKKDISVAIAYDSRIKSDYFAKSAAEVFAGNGIKVYIYSELMPTPMLSFAVRELKTDSGVVVTASHNPGKYNGYKVYGNDGCQLTLEAAEIVLNKINALDIFNDLKSKDFDEGLKDGSISYIGQEVIDKYLDNVQKQSLHPEVCETSGLKVVYTPLNGAGNKPVRAILNRIGINDVTVVPEQEMPDGTFKTCPYPNPEITEALQLGLDLCKKIKPDLLLATDPDSDRVGIAVPDGDDFVLFSGNETGALLLEYICSERTSMGTMPKNSIAIKTIVTTDITKAISEQFGVELIEVLTGFKFIGEQIGYLEQNGEEDRYLFGFEESYGYLSGTYVRDKDAVVASMLICEMAAFYRSKGISLLQARENMYAKYGCYLNKLDNFTCEGASGMQRMQEIMSDLRKAYPSDIAGTKVIRFADYLSSEIIDLEAEKVSEINLPKSDVLTLYLDGNSSIIIRPSGTEPKIKVYYSVKGDTLEEANDVQKKYSEEFTKILGF